MGADIVVGLSRWLGFVCSGRPTTGRHAARVKSRDHSPNASNPARRAAPPFAACLNRPFRHLNGCTHAVPHAP